MNPIDDFIDSAKTAGLAKYDGVFQGITRSAISSTCDSLKTDNRDITISVTNAWFAKYGYIDPATGKVAVFS